MNFRELMLEQKRLILDTSHLFEHRDAILGRDATDISINPNTPDITQCIDSFAITTVENVRSLEVIDELYEEIRDKWKNVKAKYEFLKSKVADDIKQKIPKEEAELVSRFEEGGTGEPWDYIIRSLGEGGNFDPTTYAYDSLGHEQALTKHNQLKANLKSSLLNGFKERLDSFKKEIDIFVKSIKKLKEEEDVVIGYKRFDSYYNDPILAKILEAIPYVKFLPCEVKALQMTETADFTNTIIVGIKGKTKGILSPDDSSGLGIVGICQLPKKSADEAKIWIRDKVKGLTETIMDDRTNPRNAIFLTAGYFGRIVEILTTGAAATKFSEIQSCLDKKRIVFLSYNAGPAITRTAITNYFKNYDNKKKPLMWTDSDFIRLLNQAIEDEYKKINGKEEVY